MLKTRPYHWFCLLGAILLEVTGSTVMKLSLGWTFEHAHIAALAIMWIAVCLSYYFLALCTTGLPIGVAYAFWEGIGLTLVTFASIFVLHEEFSIKRLFGLLCVLIGAWLVHRGTTHGERARPSKKSS